MFKHLRLKNRLLLSFFFITCVSTFATTSFAIYYFSNKIQWQAQLNMRKHIRVARLLYDNKTAQIRQSVDRLGHDNSLSLILQFVPVPSKIHSYLTPILHTEAVHQIFVLDSDFMPLGQVSNTRFTALHTAQNFAHNHLLQQVKQQQQTLASIEVIQKDDQQWLSISAASPIFPSKKLSGMNQDNNHKPLGFVLVRYILNQDQALVGEIQNLLGVTASFFHQQKAISYQREPNTANDIHAPYITPLIYQALMQGEETYESSTLRLQGELAQYQALYDINQQAVAVMGVSTQAKSYLHTIYQATFTLVMIMLICILGASLLGYWMARSILGPLEKLLEGVKRLTSGDLSHEIAIDLRDELGMLATAFNSMSRQLKELFNTLEQRVENATQRLQNTLAHLSAIIDNMADGLLVTDQNGKIIRLNPALSAMFEHQMAIQDQTCTQFHPHIAQLVVKSRQHQNTVHSAEIALSQGRVGHAAVTAIMHKDSFDASDSYQGSKYIGSVVLLRDITQEKEVDAMLKNTVDTLTRTGTALSSETNMNKLLEMFVQEARNACSADGGTLYTLDNQQLHFKIVQNESLGIFMGGTSGQHITLPSLELDDRRVAAYCANHKIVVKALDIANNQDFDFSGVRQYDAEMGYKTVGMLAVPLLNRQNQAVGVLQLINPMNGKTGEHSRFEKNQIEIIYSLASQAAVAIENVTNHEKIERKNAAFKRFVPTEFIRRLGKEEIEEIDLGDAAQASMSVLFADIRTFTSLSERMTPEQTFNFLNDYLKHIGPNIVGHQGFIDKYIGDAIMALFPGECINAADDAVAAAIGMMNSLEHYNQTLQRNGEKPVHIGIGIHTGPLTLGTLGFEERLETTVIGDSVNLASRMEGLTKQYGIHIGITEATYQGLKTPQSYLIREIDTVQVKGKTRPITIYDVFEGDPPPLREQKTAALNTYQTALHLYQQRDWTQALSIFTQLQQQMPEDKVVHIYVERCTQLCSTPPVGAWSGITQLTQK